MKNPGYSRAQGAHAVRTAYQELIAASGHIHCTDQCDCPAWLRATKAQLYHLLDMELSPEQQPPRESPDPRVQPHVVLFVDGGRLVEAAEYCRHGSVRVDVLDLTGETRETAIARHDRDAHDVIGLRLSTHEMRPCSLADD